MKRRGKTPLMKSAVPEPDRATHARRDRASLFFESLLVSLRARSGKVSRQHRACIYLFFRNWIRCGTDRASVLFFGFLDIVAGPIGRSRPTGSGVPCSSFFLSLLSLTEIRSIGRSPFSSASVFRCGPDRARPPDDLGLCSKKQWLEFFHELL